MVDVKEAAEKLKDSRLQRVSLFDFDISGFENAKFLIKSVKIRNGKPTSFDVYATEDQNTQNLLKHLVTHGGQATFRTYSKEGAILDATLVDLNGITYYADFDWEKPDQVLVYHVIL